MKKKNKLSFSFDKESFDINKIKSKIFEFFLEHSEIVFMIFFVVISSFSGFLIYKYIYSSTWNDERKSVYLQELKKGEINFKLSEFDAVVEKIKKRALRYKGEENSPKVRDIFGTE